MAVCRTRMIHSARRHCGQVVGTAGGEQRAGTELQRKGGRGWTGGRLSKGCTLRVRGSAELKVASSQRLQLSTSQRCILLLEICVPSSQLMQSFTYILAGKDQVLAGRHGQLLVPCSVLSNSICAASYGLWNVANAYSVCCSSAMDAEPDE